MNIEYWFSYFFLQRTVNYVQNKDSLDCLIRY
jgi:hypothetical protein